MDERSDAVREQFNRDSIEYLSKHLRPENKRETQRIINLARKETKFNRVLDIGCGPGTLTENLLEISDQVFGMDISEDMVNVATKRFLGTPFQERVAFAQGNAEKMNFPDEYFDAVFCIGVLRYLPSLDDGLKEIYRVLKPGGTVIVTFYYKFSPFWFSAVFLYRPLLPFISLLKGRSIRECIGKYKAEPLPFAFNKFKETFVKTGFSGLNVQHSGFELFPFNRIFPSASRFLYLKLESLFFNSNSLGWIGSICLAKGTKP